MTKGCIAAFGAYVVLAASHWALQDAFASTVSGNELQVLVFGLAVAGAGASGLEWPSVGRLQGWQTVCSGLLLFGLPSVLRVIPGAILPVLTRVSLLALIPAVLVLVDSVRKSGATQFLSLLGASLAGVAGCLLFLPVDLATLLLKPAATAAMLSALISIAVGSYLSYNVSREMPFRPTVVLLAGPTVIVMLAIVAATPSCMTVPSWTDVVGVLWGAAELLLLLYLVRLVPPVALGTRFLLVPLVTAVEGFVLLRPPLPVRLLAGAVLLSLGIVWLLRVNDGQVRDSSLSLL